MTYPFLNRRDGSGSEMRGQAGENLGDRKVVYWDSNGLWMLADADAIATMPTIGFTIGSIASGNFGRILLRGLVGKQGWTWTRGAKLYVSATAGEITHTAPSRSQVIGIAYETDVLYFDPKDAITDATRTKTVPMSADAFGRPNANPPGIVDQDNLTLYTFTLNTDKLTINFPVPWDYASGDIIFNVIWTNDGGVDDNGKFVKWQLDYQVGVEGDVISGSHANSPKVIEDAYPSASGFVETHTGDMTIAAADFAGKQCIFVKLSAVTPAGAALTCEPHLVGMCYAYTAYVNQ